MEYVVMAVCVDGRRGAFTVEIATKLGAIKSARRFRKQGFMTSITGPDGKPVDETQDEPREGRRT